MPNHILLFFKKYEIKAHVFPISSNNVYSTSKIELTTDFCE
jgi:hypothetical protein